MSKSVVGAALAVICVIAAPVMAGMITQTQPFSGTPNLDATLTFNEFDDLGGTRTLDSIEVLFGLGIDGGQLNLDNDGDQPASGTFEFGAKGDLSSGDVALLDVAFQPVTAELESFHSQAFALDANVGDGPLDYDPSPPDGMQYNGGPKSDSDSGFISPTVHSQYVGSGTYDIIAQVKQWQDFGGVSGIEWAVTPVTAAGEVTVIYRYSPAIPEPASLGLLAFGGLAALGRRRR